MHTVLGMHVKEDITFANVIAIPLISFLEYSGASFLSAQTIFFLKDRVFFKTEDADEKQMGEINS